MALWLCLISDTTRPRDESSGTSRSSSVVLPMPEWPAMPKTFMGRDHRRCAMALQQCMRQLTLDNVSECLDKSAAGSVRPVP